MQKSSLIKKKRMLFGAVYLLLVVIIAVFGLFLFRRKPDDETTVRMGYLPITACLPYFVGEDKGFFTDKSVDVEPVRFESSKDMMDALLQNKVDIVTSAASSLAFIVEEKTPGQFKIFGVNTNGTANPLNVLMVKSDSPIQNANQLKGKKIGTFPGIQAVTLLKRYLRSQGLDPAKDVTIQEMNQELHLQALQSGQVDAILTYEPNATIGTTKGFARTIALDPFSQASVNPYPTGIFAISNLFLSEHRQVAERFIAAHDESMRYADKHQAEARQYLPKIFAIDPVIAEKVPLSLNETRSNLDLATFQRFADIFTEEGVLKTKVDTEKLIYK